MSAGRLAIASLVLASVGCQHFPPSVDESARFARSASSASAADAPRQLTSEPAAVPPRLTQPVTPPLARPVASRRPKPLAAETPGAEPLKVEPAEAKASAVQPVALVQEVPRWLPTATELPVSTAGDDDTAEPATARLGLESLQQLALANNPTLQRAAAQIEAARGRWVQVGLPPNTLLGFTGQQLFSGGEAEQRGILIGQEFVRGGKLSLNRAVAAQEIRMAAFRCQIQQRRVLTDVQLAYYDVLVAQRRIELAEQLQEIARQAVQTAEALFGAEEVSRIDVLRAQVEWQTARVTYQNAHNDHAAAWQRLTAVLAVPSLPKQPLQGQLEARQVSPIEFDPTLQQILAQSPELQYARAEVQRARWVVQRAQAEPIPNIDVQSVVQQDNATGSANANLQVVFPVPWLDRNQGAIRQARAEAVAAERQAAAVELGLQQRLATTYQRFANARNRVVDYAQADGILETSEAALDLVHKGYQAGEIGYLDLITAQRTFFETNLIYLQALEDFWAARVEIEGLLLKDSL